VSGSVVVAYVGPGGNVITQVVNAGEQFDINSGLVTPISQAAMSMMIRAAWGLHVFINTPTTFISPDRRIYFVSPVSGAPGNSGGGGGEPTAKK
jgi:hypothetical protein